MARISYASPKKTLNRPDLTKAVKGKEIDIAHDLVINSVDLHQDEQFIVGFTHFKKAHRLKKFGCWKAPLFKCFYRDMVIAGRTGERVTIGKLARRKRPILIYKACIIRPGSFFFPGVLRIGTSCSCTA